jgi:hypothetical protein
MASIFGALSYMHPNTNETRPSARICGIEKYIKVREYEYIRNTLK